MLLLIFFVVQTLLSIHSHFVALFLTTHCTSLFRTWTLTPTATPTALASSSPSASPTTPHPTSRPSAIPSISPTKDVCVVGWENSCQDDESYVSPQGTDCATFKTLDCFLFDGIYDPNEWIELVNACPCSCNIECG